MSHGKYFFFFLPRMSFYVWTFVVFASGVYIWIVEIDLTMGHYVWWRTVKRWRKIDMFNFDNRKTIIIK